MHTSWASIANGLGRISPLQLGVLVTVWLAGLYVHSFVTTGALPGLTHRRAMALNFSGSAVSHLSPFGGVLGVAVNYTMVQSWGFDGSSFAVLVLLTNACSVMCRLLLPMIALALLLMFGLHPPGMLIAPAFVGLAVVGSLATIAGLALRAPSDGSGSLTRSASSVARRLFGHAGGDAVLGARTRVHLDLRAIVGHSWRRLTLGMIGYALLQAALLWLCLLTVGAHLSPFGTFAAYAVGSALSLVPFTPGGVGFAEAGTAAVLFGVGGSPGAVAAAVLLYSAFTRWMEIPIGAGTTAWWWIHHRLKPRRSAMRRGMSASNTSASPRTARSHACEHAIGGPVVSTTCR